MNSHLRTPSLQGTKTVGKGGSKGLQKIRTHGISTERDKNLEKCGFGKIERSSG